MENGKGELIFSPEHGLAAFPSQLSTPYLFLCRCYFSQTRCRNLRSSQPSLTQMKRRTSLRSAATWHRSNAHGTAPTLGRDRSRGRGGLPRVHSGGRAQSVGCRPRNGGAQFHKPVRPGLTRGTSVCRQSQRPIVPGREVALRRHRGGFGLDVDCTRCFVIPFQLLICSDGGAI